MNQVSAHISQDLEDKLRRYVQSYPDLVKWASSGASKADLINHMNNVGLKERRVVHDSKELPTDWSDWLFEKHYSDPAMRHLLRLGVIETGFHHANAANRVDWGLVGVSQELAALRQLPPPILQQFVDIDGRAGASSPLYGLRDGSLSYRKGTTPVTVPVLNEVGRVRAALGHIDVVIIVPWLETGGAELEALWIYRAAEELGLNAAFILTTDAAVTPRFSVHNPRIVNLPEITTRVCGVDFRHISMNIQTNILHHTLSMLAPRVVHIVHSWTAYRLLLSESWRNKRSEAYDIVLSAFCSHLHASGKIDGYYRYFPEIDKNISTYLYDNTWYAEEMARTYNISPGKSAVLNFPIEECLSSVPLTLAETRRRVLWASRLDFQKNPQIVFAIAEQMPDVRFDMFGRVVLKDEDFNWHAAPANVRYCGEFYTFESLNPSDYDCFLYTSRFDGMPNIILESASFALPIVAGRAGGIGDFLNSTTGLIVEDPLDVVGYVEALQTILSDSELRTRLADSAIAALQHDRMFSSFVTSMSDLGVYRKILDGI